MDNAMTTDKDMELKLREELNVSICRHIAPGLLFSGGLDTSILAAICPEMIAINISLEDFSLDLKYAKIVEQFLGLKVHYRRITITEAINSIPEIIKISQSFDPAIPNDITVYFGLKCAEELKVKAVMTGDGADELFAGYDYMRGMSDLDNYIRRITKNMSCSSNLLGNFFKIKIKQPYLDKQFVDFSINEVPVELKVAETKGTVYGKWILRKAFEGILPAEIVWQSKRPLEYGSGTTELRKIISDRISDDEYARKKKMYPVKFITKDHLYYYQIYKEVVGEIPKPKKTQDPCPGCGGGIPLRSFHCRICGWVRG